MVGTYRHRQLEVLAQGKAHDVSLGSTMTSE